MYIFFFLTEGWLVLVLLVGWLVVGFFFLVVCVSPKIPGHLGSNAFIFSLLSFWATTICNPLRTLLGEIKFSENWRSEGPFSSYLSTF